MDPNARVMVSSWGVRLRLSMSLLADIRRDVDVDVGGKWALVLGMVNADVVVVAAMQRKNCTRALLDSCMVLVGYVWFS